MPQASVACFALGYRCPSMSNNIDAHVTPVPLYRQGGRELSVPETRENMVDALERMEKENLRKAAIQPERPKRRSMRTLEREDKKMRGRYAIAVPSLHALCDDEEDESRSSEGAAEVQPDPKNDDALLKAALDKLQAPLVRGAESEGEGELLPSSTSSTTADGNREHAPSEQEEVPGTGPPPTSAIRRSSRTGRQPPPPSPEIASRRWKGLRDPRAPTEVTTAKPGPSNPPSRSSSALRRSLGLDADSAAQGTPESLLVVPGVWDGLSTRMALHRGHRTVLISEMGLAITRWLPPLPGSVGISDLLNAADHVVRYYRLPRLQVSCGNSLPRPSAGDHDGRALL